MRKKAFPSNKYHFTSKLESQLALIPRHPLTVVEAPAGFGKTTAIREYLRHALLPQGADEYWYTCLGEPAALAWRGICELLANVSDTLPSDLRRLSVPSMETLLDITACLKHIVCETETYLVIDNFQLVGCDIPRELISVFSMHQNPKLHIIFITQQLGAKQQFYIHNTNIHTIDSSVFFFDREGTASLFRLENIRLSDEELENVFISTEGWVSAIKLQILNYQQTGTFDHTADIEQLVETAIWNRLRGDEQDFLLKLSVLDSFNIRQATLMAEQERLPDTLETLLKTNDFIRYHPDKRVYTMHSLLLDYLRYRLEHHQSGDFQRSAVRLAGQSFAAAKQYIRAAQYYLSIRDYDAILSLPLCSETFYGREENNLPEFIPQLIEQCPEQTLCKYPAALYTLSIQAYLAGQLALYQHLCALLQRAADMDTGASPHQVQRHKAHCLIARAMGSFNDLEAISGAYQQAFASSQPPLIKVAASFTMGCPSMLFLFWREPGKLQQSLGHMNTLMPLHSAMTFGHGAGADSAMAAEALLLRSEDNEAEILCHKALYDARSHAQTGVCISAEFTLAKIALLRADVNAYAAAVSNLQGYAGSSSDPYVLRMAQLCQFELSLLLGEPAQAASWLTDMNSMQKSLYPPAMTYAQTLYASLLLSNKRYNELLGLSQHILDRPVGNAQHALARIHLFKLLCISMLEKGNLCMAQEYAAQTLALALPDQAYLPLVQQPALPVSLLERMRGNPADRVGIDAVIALHGRLAKGIGGIQKARQAQSPLTPREREVAQLSKERLSAKEIATKLYISETTVRTILRSVYSKLDIHSRSELIGLEL